jgi:hypothetical protein
MASWILIPCLVRLRSEFNTIAPTRDHASDGSIGDAAHQSEVSDHNPDETGSVPIHDADHVNEVHAIDVDDDLRQSDLTMEKVVQFLLGRCRSGTEKRLRYIIYNRRIWEASNDWRQRTYTGSSPHTEHAHFSASYVSKLEASTASWHLEDIPVALTAADKTWISQQISAAVASLKASDVATADDLLNARIGDKASPTRTVGDVFRDTAKLRGYLVGDPADTANAAIPATAPVARQTAAADAVLGEPPAST